MKNLFLVALFFGCFSITFAQNEPKVGDALTIKEPSSQLYNHIDFPRLNILVKRGSLPNYKSVYNNDVVVEEVITKKDGSVDVVLKKKDGSKFFGFLPKVKANYSKALAANEIVVAR